MNIPDWAITPGARKSRYGTPSDGIAWIRLNVSPKITSHRTGWTARVNSSGRAWRSFWSSTRQKMPTRDGYRRSVVSALSDATGGAASASDGTQSSLGRVTGKRATGVMSEHVLQRRVGRERGLELGRRALGADRAQV